MTIKTVTTYEFDKNETTDLDNALAVLCRTHDYCNHVKHGDSMFCARVDTAIDALHELRQYFSKNP